MSSPFDREDGEFLVLRNDEEQYSLWPGPFAVPSGWEPVFGPAERERCKAWLREHWTDMRPRSLREALDA